MSPSRFPLKIDPIPKYDGRAHERWQSSSIFGRVIKILVTYTLRQYVKCVLLFWDLINYLRECLTLSSPPPLAASIRTCHKLTLVHLVLRRSMISLWGHRFEWTKYYFLAIDRYNRTRDDFIVHLYHYDLEFVINLFQQVCIRHNLLSRSRVRRVRDVRSGEIFRSRAVGGDWH